MKSNPQRQTKRIHSSPKITPYLPVPGDPAYVRPRDKSKKVLTSLTPWYKLKSGNKPGRKDDKMVKKQKQMRAAPAVSLLTIFGVIGVAHILGDELRHYIMAGILCLLLFAYATDK